MMVQLTKEEDINQAVAKFYKDLYETEEVVENDDTFFDNINPIPGERADQVVNELTQDELRQTLKTCKDSAPGPDGISYSYLEAYWDVFGPLLVNSWKYSLVSGNLPASHKTSVLRLIPKAGKDLKKLTNWRPITLSNCDHKLITKVLASRLTKH